MKTLLEYKKNGFHFKLLHRDGDLAIFRGKNSLGESETFEIIVVGSHQGMVIGGVDIPPAEFAPSNNQWGTKGWTATSEKLAFELFNNKKAELLDKQQKKKNKND
jgi:hypothetical protein